MPASETVRQCEEAVDRVLGRHAWQLLERDAFVRRTVEAVSDGTVTEPQRAAVHVYSLALYHACSGSDGAARQERAYTELFHYLYSSARRQYPDLCEDAAQLAIERVYATFDRCRVPAAFLAWSFQQLRDAARSLRRQTARLAATPVEEVLAPGLEPPVMLPLDPTAHDPVGQVVRHEMQDRLRQMVAGFLQQHPRANHQLTALLLKYLWGLDDEAISRRLDKSVESVYVLRARAKKKLQQEPEWQALAKELGIL